MRKALQQIGDKERHTYTGTFVRTGTKSGYKGMLTTILLQDIKDSSGTIVTDHLWFNQTKGFINAAPAAGDILQFDARVAEYVKGYFGYREDVYNPPSMDYKLERPTRIKNLTHPDAKPKITEKPEPVQMPEEETCDASYYDHPTEKQASFIESIAKTLDIPVPKDLTLKTASEWIDKHVKAFQEEERRQNHEAMMQKILPYVQKNTKTKDACAELGISASTYLKYRHEAEDRNLI